MKTISRYIMTLALLITAATGAWAQDVLNLVVDGTSATIKYDGNASNNPILGERGWEQEGDTWDQKKTTRPTITSVTIDGSCKNFSGTSLSNLFFRFSGLTTINGLENLNTANVQDMEYMFASCSSLTSLDLSSWNTASVTTMFYMFANCSKLTSLDLSSWNTENVKKTNSLFLDCSELTTVDLSSWNTAKVWNTSYMFANCSKLENIYVGDGWSTAAVTRGDDMFNGCTKLPGYDPTKTTHAMAKLVPEGYLTTKTAGPAVNLNEAKTEASFEMPTYDVNFSYELVRDITQKVDVETRIDGAATERIRIAKDNDGHYKFATKQGWQFAAVDKLDNNKDLTNGELTYTLKMKVGNEYVAKNFDTELCPGTWRLEATANAEKPYEGTAYGPDIELYAGYEITVPAGEYATFYKDENLYTEDENAELYTISEVNATQAVLSDAVQIMPKNTPMLVYNKGTEEKTFLLIPTEDEANQVTAANEFKGTLSTMGMPGSTSITDYYVCTGKAFRWVKNAGTIGANKCWLQIGEQPATTRANTRSIVGGGNTTGIDGIENDESAVEGYYDLNGRKLQGKPTRGGIYIQNGRKVIVR